LTEPGINDDLDVCAREPIHVPDAIQPHGVLLVLDGDGTVLQASANSAHKLGRRAQAGMALADVLPDVAAALSADWMTEDDVFRDIVVVDGGRFHAVAQRVGECIVLELETLADGPERGERLFSQLRRFVDRILQASDIEDIAHLVAKHVRAVTGFDRVLVYRFDQEWNGTVIGESGNGALPSYLGLRFPASDIPEQARRLYRTNRVRIIPTADYDPIPLEPTVNPLTGGSLDMSFSILRSVSPVHLEYMRNMGTAASMSISILVDGELWGLVACHSRKPHMVPLGIREACDFAVQSVAAQIAGRVRTSDAARRLRLGEVSSRLLTSMAATSDWRRGLLASPKDLLAQVDASGAAVVFDDACWSLGECPDEAQIRAIVDWLETHAVEDVHAIDRLVGAVPGADAFADVASGLLAARISELHPSWLLWFRPEVARTVTWGGDPHKVVREAGRIHPRHSFEAWKELVEYTADPWQPAEIAAARDLRSAIVGIVLRRAEELAKLAEELQRSNRELEAFSYSISHDLRAPFRHIVGFSELLREREKALDEKSRHYLDSISESALAAGRLVDDLLSFSHLGRTPLTVARVDMDKIVTEVRRSLEMMAGARKIVWKIDPLPPGWGDATLLRQVWFNLAENAVKYSRPRDATVIEIGGRAEEGETIYWVADNGVGFDMAYVEKLFGVFQRLQRAEDFEGTGIGLALTKRIMDRHGGRIWAEGEVDRGARFTFALPNREPSAETKRAATRTERKQSHG
jgi:chemotaxis family two-component system sensor kinase Cph1